jgi:hypothetical protein
VKQKAILSVILILLAFLTPGTRLNEKALQIHEASFERAISAFAIAKGLNAVISLIQGTELNASPAGVGVTVAVGEILDPMNDLIERFSWIMLVASVSLGIQKLLLSLGGLLYLQITLFALIVMILGILWYKPLQNTITLSMTLRLAVILLILRFGAFFFIYAESMIYTTLLEQEYNTATQTLTRTQAELENIATQNDEKIMKDESWLDSLNNSYGKVKELIDIKMQLQSLQILFDNAQKEVISLIAIFVVLTILLPLLFIWILFGVIKWALTGRLPHNLQKFLSFPASSDKLQ